MESVACPLCGDDRSSLVRRARDRLAPAPARSTVQSEFELVRCRRCGLVYVNPRPTRDEIGRYYPPVYQAPPHARRVVPRLEEAYRLRQHAEVARWLARRRPARGRLLDVGCGSGELIAALRADGWDVAGIEPSSAAVERGRARHGLDIAHCTLEEAELIDGGYDAVVLSASLEHMHDPLAALRRVRRLAAPAGLVAVLYLPMVDAPQARLFGSRWLALDVPRHLVHFTPATFAAAASMAGLRIESCETYSRRHNASMWTASLLPGLQKQRLHMLAGRSRARSYAGSATYLALTTIARPLARAEAALGCTPMRSYFLVPA